MKPFVFGHRGAMAYEPENTLRSFRRAIDSGAYGIELDVRRCKSKEIVVIHDEKVDRTTNAKGCVGDFSLKELKKLDAGKGEKIPALEEVIDFVKKINEQENKNIKLTIEIKEENLEKDIIERIKKCKIIDKVVMISFYHNIVKRIKKVNNKIKTGILFIGNPVDASSMAKDADADFLFPNFNYVDESLVENAHKNKLKVFVWNVDDIKNLENMLKLKVDGIGSNKPDVIVDYLRKEN